MTKEEIIKDTEGMCKLAKDLKALMEKFYNEYYGSEEFLRILSEDDALAVKVQESLDAVLSLNGEG